MTEPENREKDSLGELGSRGGEGAVSAQHPASKGSIVQYKSLGLKSKAKQYYDQGFNVVALRFEGEKDSVLKKPLVEWGEWQGRRQTLEEFEAQPWDRADGFGIVCGFPNNDKLFLAVVDYDVKKVSEEAKARGREILNRFPVTRMEETVSGGTHLVYLSRVKPMPVRAFHESHALELIASGNICIMSPSRGYRNLNDDPPREVEDAQELFYQVLSVRDEREKVNEGVSNERLLKWLEQIKAKLEIVGEGNNYLYALCPFHAEEHPSFAINKSKFYAIDYHDGKVYSMKVLGSALGVELEGASIPSLELGRVRVEVQGKDCFVYGEGGKALRSFKVSLLNSKGIARWLAETSGLGEAEVSAKVAEFLLKRKEGEKARGEGEPEPVFNMDWLSVHPAIDIVNGKAYVGVKLPCRIKSKDGGEEPRDFSFLVSSDRRVISCRHESLIREKIKLAHTVVKMPNRWSLQGVKAWLEGQAKVEPGAVYEKVKMIFEKYIEFDEPVLYDFVTLWSIGTYFFFLFPAYPYLYIGGIKRSGKTKLLQILKEVCFNAILSGDMSTASLFRLVQSGRCTVLLDETEELSNPETKESIRRMLLNGYKRGGVVFRTDKDTGVPEAYEVYSPKAMANIRGLEDVLEDRTIPIVLKRGKKTEIVNSEIKPEDTVWQEIRDMLYLLILSRFSEVCVVCEVSEDEGEGALKERERELWRPILCLAKYFDQWHGGLYSRILEFAKKKAEERLVENMTETGEYLLVETLLNIVKQDGFYAVKDILNTMSQRFDETQKWLNTKWVGRALKRLGFTEKRRIGTGVEVKMTVAQVEDLAERLSLLSKAPSGRYSQTTQTAQTTLMTIKEEEKRVATPSGVGHDVERLVELENPQDGICERCGKPARLRWSFIMPNQERVLLCGECAGEYLPEPEEEEFEEMEKVFEEFTEVKWLPAPFQGRCAACGKEGNVYWKARKEDGVWVFLCEMCGLFAGGGDETDG